MRGLGPFVINDITSAGAIRLEILEEEPMANYINGSRLHIYNEPLTTCMLEMLHAGKRRKIVAEKLK